MATAFIRISTQQTQPNYPLNRPVIITSPVNATAALGVDIDGNTTVDFTYEPPDANTIIISGDASGFGSDTIEISLSETGVTPGTYNSVTVDAKGRVTAGTNNPTSTQQTASLTLTLAGEGAPVSDILLSVEQDVLVLRLAANVSAEVSYDLYLYDGDPLNGLLLYQQLGINMANFASTTFYIAAPTSGQIQALVSNGSIIADVQLELRYLPV